MGEAAAFDCACYLHALADGRDGVLTVVEKPKQSLSLVDGDLFEDLPVAICAIAENGDLLFANEMARNLFDQNSIKAFQLCSNLLSQKASSLASIRRAWSVTSALM